MNYILIEPYHHDYGEDGDDIGTVAYTFASLDGAIDYLVKKSKWSAGDCVLVEGGTVLELCESRYRDPYYALCQQETERRQTEARLRKAQFEASEYQRLKEKFEGGG
jgi:hypothetical protein